MKIFRITLEVSNLDQASKFYAKLLAIPGQRHPGSRHYFDVGNVILAILDPTPGGLKPTPGAKSLYFAVDELEPVHARAKELKALAPFKVHGESAGDIVKVRGASDRFTSLLPKKRRAQLNVSVRQGAREQERAQVIGEPGFG
jgi:catechol 2,3-dioxygenase-like lactoylglutathione lyase family enzyme